VFWASAVGAEALREPRSGPGRSLARTRELQGSPTHTLSSTATMMPLNRRQQLPAHPRGAVQEPVPAQLRLLLLVSASGRRAAPLPITCAQSLCRFRILTSLGAAHQTAAQRIDCSDFESQPAFQRSAAPAVTGADDVDRLHHSLKQHAEKIRCDRWLFVVRLRPTFFRRTLEMDLTMSNQELAMLKFQNGLCRPHVPAAASRA
jgi:hypothetical protein